MSKSQIPRQVRSALDQLDPRTPARRSGLRRAAKWSPIAVLAVAVGVFAYRCVTANTYFATRTDD